MNRKLIHLILSIHSTRASDISGSFPDLKEFYENPLFASCLSKIGNIEQKGAQTQGVKVLEHTLDVMDSFYKIVSGDYKYYQERCGLTELTFNDLRAFALAVMANGKMRTFFHLIVYAHDFGKIDKNGPGHQTAGVPYIEDIMRSMDYNSQLIEWGKELVRLHTFPAELFLGEGAPQTLASISTQFSEKHGGVSFLQILVLLNICDVNSIKGGASLFEQNTRFMISLINEKEVAELTRDFYGDRLRRVCASAFPKRVSPEQQIAIDEATGQRLAELQQHISGFSIDEQERIRSLLERVDFHYTANLFPDMSVEGIAHFLRISAEKCFADGYDNPAFMEVISLNDKEGKKLDAYIRQVDDLGIADKLLKLENGQLIWNPNVI